MKTFVIYDSETGEKTGCLVLDNICAFFINEDDPTKTDVIYPGKIEVVVPILFDEFLALFEAANGIKQVLVDQPCA